MSIPVGPAPAVEVLAAPHADAEALGIGGGGVLITGSVITAGEARLLLGGR